MINQRKSRLLLLTLLIIFISYNIYLYINQNNYGTIQLTNKALQGEEIWRENNCNACHQLYGLGGYLGPDLTNIYSNKYKGEAYIKSMVNSGIKTMPKFEFNESEKEALVQFLKEIDQTGYYPNYNAEVQKNGWVKISYKDIEHEKQ